jgi:hypothetical protein
LAIDRILCPSARCNKDAILLGVIQEDGHVQFIEKRTSIDNEFVKISKEGRAPERRFRFSDTCVEKKCAQWTGSQCGIIHEIIDAIGSDIHSNELPSCSIRSECRWFRQCGTSACHVCPYVITDLNPES